MHKNTLPSLVLVATLSFPSSAGAVVVEAMDGIAGLGTEITAKDMTPGERGRADVRSPDGVQTTYPLTADASGTARGWIPGNELQTAGRYDVGLRGASGQLHAQSTLTIAPDTVDSGESDIITQGNNGETIVSVMLRDRYGNPLPGRIAELISSNASDVITTLTRETDAYGEQRFRVLTNGSYSTFRAMDLLSGTLIDASSSIGASRGGYAMKNSTAPTYGAFYGSATNPGNLTAQVASRGEPGGFEITISGQENVAVPQVRVNEAESMMVAALDQNGSRYFDFARDTDETVYLFSTDPRAELPRNGEVTFSFRDQGRKQYTLGLIFRTPGSHRLVISDRPDAVNTILGELTVEVVGQQFQEQSRVIRIREPLSNTMLNSETVTVTGTGPAFINILVQGGTQEVMGETDRDGNFSVSVPLDTTKTDHTIQVVDRDGRYTSESVSFRIDVTPPVVESAIFTPEKPVEGTDTLLVVTTEPGTKGVEAEIAGQTYSLMSTDATTGKYQMLVTAPAAGTYNAIIRLSDSLGNIAEQTVPFTVNMKGLPQVRNVVAEGQINAVSLRWDPVTDAEVDAYRIYVGTASPEGGVEFLYTLDTDRPTAAATVAGLRPGTTYHFAVTVLQSDREGEQRSDIASATALGVQLETTPGDGSLLLRWTSLGNDLPLSAFRLEYGTEPDTFTEHRVLNGELRAYTLRDLINGVTYYLKLTPITTTGERIDDLASTGEGTPTGAGFTRSAADPVPFQSIQGSSGLHGGAPPTPTPPATTGTGVPAWMLAVIVLMSSAIFGVHLQQRKKKQMTVAFLQAMHDRYHRS